MILGVDGGLRNCGWARVTPRARVVAIGVITTAKDPSVAKSTDRSLRTTRLADELGVVADDCTAIAAEAMSFPRGTDGIAALALCWGVIATLASMRGLTLLEVEPKVWQRAVLPGSGRKVDYTALTEKLADFASLNVREQLAAIPKALREHALDAMAIAVFAAVGAQGGTVVRKAA